MSSHHGIMPGKPSYNLEDRPSRPPILLRYRSSKWFIGMACFITTFTDGVLYSVIVPLLPFTLVRRSGIRPDMVQSWITILFVVFGCCMVLGAPVAGWVTQHSSLRQVPLISGLTAALAATLLFMLAKATWLLVIARCLQGISAGVVYTTVLALLVETVERNEVGSWIGFALSGVNLGVLVAPVIAGILYEKAGYYAVFAICLAIIALDLLLAILLVDKKRARKWSADGPEQGSANSAGPTIPNGSHRNDSSPAYPSAQDGEDSPLLSNDARKAKASPRKWFPITRALLASPQILAALYTTFIHAMLHTSFDAVLPRFVQRTFHWSPSGAGLIFLTLTVPSLMSPLFGFLSDRYGRRMGINLFLTSLVTDMSFAVERLEEEDPQFSDNSGAYTEAYALVDITFGAGTVFGPLLGGLLYEHTTWAITYGVFAAFTFSGSIPVMFYTAGLPPKAHQETDA
ncbi:MAG: hypothetical protein Q9219_003971 [cf. Caloplaca sp. 3 TL-2023]